VARRVEGRIAFIGLPAYDSQEAMRAFVDEFDLPFPQGIDEDGDLWTRFGVLGTGSWVLIDGTGHSTLIPIDLDAEELTRALEDAFG
jgi:hypothetical protein